MPLLLNQENGFFFFLLQGTACGRPCSALYSPLKGKLLCFLIVVCSSFVFPSCLSFQGLATPSKKIVGWLVLRLLVKTT